MNEIVHVLLIYLDDEDYASCRLFHTKEGVLSFMRETIKDAYADESFDAKEMIEEMEQSMNNNGYWRDGVDGTTYVYDEKEFTE